MKISFTVFLPLLELMSLLLLKPSNWLMERRAKPNSLKPTLTLKRTTFLFFLPNCRTNIKKSAMKWLRNWRMSLKVKSLSSEISIIDLNKKSRLTMNTKLTFPNSPKLEKRLLLRKIWLRLKPILLKSSTKRKPGRTLLLRLELLVRELKISTEKRLNNSLKTSLPLLPRIRSWISGLLVWTL